MFIVHCSLFNVQLSFLGSEPYPLPEGEGRITAHERPDLQGSGGRFPQQDRIMHNLSYWVEQTFRFRPNTVKLPLGYFANVMILEMVQVSPYPPMASEPKSLSPR